MVGKICTVCKNSSYINKQLSFFTYPGDPERRHEWLKAVDRLDLLEKLKDNRIRGNHRICEVHFDPKFVKRSTVCEGRKSLSKEAFPTLCLDSIGRFTKAKQAKRTPDLSEDDEDIQSNEQVPEQEDTDDISDDDLSSSQSLPDISEFLESVIKVSKGTQTSELIETYATITHEDEIEGVLELKMENIRSRRTFLELCGNYLSDGMTQLIKSQLTSDNVCKNYNSNIFALTLYYTGHNSYDFLKNVLGLPTTNSLRLFLIPKTTRLTNVLLKCLKAKVINMSMTEKLCSVSVGSISLKTRLHYDIKFDRILGLHDVDGMQNLEPAKYAVVIMVQGIIKNWKQIIGYAFISDYDNFPEISMWIDSIIIKLIDIGLDVRAFLSDPRSEFLYASETRQVSPDQTYFTLNDRNIYYLYDTSQLFKVVKNNLRSCDFHCNGTGDFLRRIYNLFNLLNTRTEQADDPYKRFFTHNEFQSEFLESMLQLFKKLKVVRKVDGVDVTENMMFIDGFQITIKSIIQLYETLKSRNIRYLMTSKLSQEKLNAFFRLVKNAEEEECTARKFNKCFIKTFVGNLMKKPIGRSRHKHRISQQIEEYSCKLLRETQIVDDEEDHFMCNKPLKIFTTDYRKGLPDKNAFVYVCGYIYSKCLENHECDQLKAFLKDFQEHKDRNEQTYLCSVSLEHVKDCKILPPENFIEFLMLLENKFKEYFKPDMLITSIGQELWKEMEDCEFDMPCPCFPMDYLKSLFIRVRLFYTIRKNNKMYRKKHGPKIFRVYSL